MLAVVLTLPDFHPYAFALGLLVAMSLQPELQTKSSAPAQDFPKPTVFHKYASLRAKRFDSTSR